MAQCPSLLAKYVPSLFLTNPHVETILAAKLRTCPAPPYRRELLRTEDGGTVALDWVDESDGQVMGTGILLDLTQLVLSLPASKVLLRCKQQRRGGETDFTGLFSRRSSNGGQLEGFLAVLPSPPSMMCLFLGSVWLDCIPTGWHLPRARNRWLEHAAKSRMRRLERRQKCASYGCMRLA